MNVADMISDRMRLLRHDSSLPTAISNLLEVSNCADTETVKGVRGVYVVVNRILGTIENKSIGREDFVKIASEANLLRLFDESDASLYALNRCFTDYLESLSISDTLRVLQGLKTANLLDKYSQWVAHQHLNTVNTDLSNAVEAAFALDNELHSIIPPSLESKLSEICLVLPSHQRISLIRKFKVPAWAAKISENLNFENVFAEDLVAIAPFISSCDLKVKSDFVTSALNCQFTDNSSALLARLFNDGRLLQRINVKRLDMTGRADAFIAAAGCGLIRLCRELEVLVLVDLEKIDMDRLVMLAKAFATPGLLKHEQDGRSILAQCMQSSK